MSVKNTLEAANNLLGKWAQKTAEPEPNRLDITVAGEDLLRAVNALIWSQWGYLTAITGLDGGPAANSMEVLYHFCSGHNVLTLRVPVPRHGGCVPSVCKLLPSATLYERELMEMFGVRVEGTPNTDRLFLPENWPDGVYPLLKDADLESALRKERAISSSTNEVAPSANANFEKFIIPIGPQHPALKEPGHFEFTIDGEIVTGATVRLGYVHRGIEKACEERTWIQDLYLLERICGICSHIHAYGYSLGVEQLAGVEAPPRAQAIRELVAGLERVHSHLLWLGVAAHEAGFDALFMYSWRDRETVMDLLESLTGNRVNYSANILGGVKFDIDPKQTQAIHQGLDYLEERTRHYLEVVTTDMAFLQRTRGIGVTTLDQAHALGLVGPTARASGLQRDVRVDAPYGAYTHFPVSTVTETAGDLEAKFEVRLKELLVSFSTMRTILDNMPDGELSVRMPRRIPEGETISRVEAPRGELFYFLKSNGGDKPERVKVRTPSMCNFSSVVHLVVGHQLADVPMILVGIDPCFSCNDRMVVVRRAGQDPQVLNWQDLRRRR